MSTLITFEKLDEFVMILTLNRPQAANAMSLQLLDEFNDIIHQIEQSSSTRCLIITGAGEKAFCAGADLKERRQMSVDDVVRTVKYIGETISNIEKLSIPVIAAINGVAYGGGLELALACDLRIAASHVKLGLTETSLAIIPGAGGTQRLPRLIGIGQAKRLIYTATPVDANEAHSIGIVEKIVANDQLLSESIKLANKIASNGPIAIRQAKLAIEKGMEVDLQSGLHIEHLNYLQTIHTEDRKEGLLAFSEKRKPKYKGR